VVHGKFKNGLKVLPIPVAGRTKKLRPASSVDTRKHPRSLRQSLFTAHQAVAAVHLAEVWVAAAPAVVARAVGGSLNIEWVKDNKVTIVTR
jgi:hypothetical protein